MDAPCGSNLLTTGTRPLLRLPVCRRCCWYLCAASRDFQNLCQRSLVIKLSSSVISHEQIKVISGHRDNSDWLFMVLGLLLGFAHSSVVIMKILSGENHLLFLLLCAVANPFA